MLIRLIKKKGEKNTGEKMDAQQRTFFKIKKGLKTSTQRFKNLSLTIMGSSPLRPLFFLLEIMVDPPTQKLLMSVFYRSS